MDATDLKDLVKFDPDVVTRQTVFETGHLWSQLLCLDRNQQVGPVGDPDSDAVFTVVAGVAVFQVDTKRRRVSQWGTVLVPSGAKVTVTNASEDPLVVMVVAAPPPVPRAVSG